MQFSDQMKDQLTTLTKGEIVLRLSEQEIRGRSLERTFTLTELYCVNHYTCYKITSFELSQLDCLENKRLEIDIIRGKSVTYGVIVFDKGYRSDTSSFFDPEQYKTTT